MSEPPMPTSVVCPSDIGFGPGIASRPRAPTISPLMAIQRITTRITSVVCLAMPTEVRAEITANVWQVRTEVGAAVAEGDELMILESMKMEIPVIAPCAGTVAELRVQPEDVVQEGDVVAVLE